MPGEFGDLQLGRRMDSVKGMGLHKITRGEKAGKSVELCSRVNNVKEARGRGPRGVDRLGITGGGPVRTFGWWPDEGGGREGGPDSLTGGERWALSDKKAYQLRPMRPSDDNYRRSSGTEGGDFLGTVKLEVLVENTFQCNPSKNQGGGAKIIYLEWQD